jgi:hypothetical protein
VTAGDPYLSVVVATRNDAHGGDALRRLHLFVDTLVALCDRHRLPAELLVVEWNPPTERPPLAEAVRWPERHDSCAIRIVQVPPHVHARLAHAERLPLFQMIAKNVGIRRASGAYVLATNMDVLLSDELVAYLAEQRLDPGSVYRVDRLDVPENVPDAAVPARLEWCARNVIRVNRREGTLDPRSGEWLTTYREPRLLTRIRNSQRWRARRVGLWRAAGGRTPRALDALFAYGNLVLGTAYTAMSGRGREANRAGSQLQLLWSLTGEPADGARRSVLSRLASALGNEASRMRLHMNGSGDFTLMSKAAWLRSGGYPELEMYSMHLDGLFLYQAHATGIRERFVPLPLYHIDHSGGFRPEAEGEEALESVLARRGLPAIGYEQLMRWFYELYRTGRPIPFNGESWGLAGESLPQLTIN